MGRGRGGVAWSLSLRARWLWPKSIELAAGAGVPTSFDVSRGVDDTGASTARSHVDSNVVVHVRIEIVVWA